jgi:hypothetical protein
MLHALTLQGLLQVAVVHQRCIDIQIVVWIACSSKNKAGCSANSQQSCECAGPALLSVHDIYAHQLA